MSILKRHKRLVKIYIFVIHACLFLLIIAVYKIDREQVPFSQRYYNETLAFQLRIDKNLVGSYGIFLGDSHIQGLAVQELEVPSLNLGIGSDTSEGVLKRLPLYSSLNKAIFIYISVGFNDLKSRSNNDIMQTLEALIEAVPKNKPVFMPLLLPINESTFIKEKVTNSRINSLNNLILQLPIKYKHVEVLDTGLKLKDNNGQLNKIYHIGDGVHLNPQGYSIMIDYLNLFFSTYQQRSKMTKEVF